MNGSAINEKLTQFFSQFSVHAYNSGHIIVPAYSQPAGVYLVRTGHVKQYTLTPEGNEYIVNMYKPGSFFPMIWAITDAPNSYFFEAFDEVELYRAPKADVLQFLEKNPDVLMDLCRRLYIGLDGLLQQATYNAVADVRKKVIGTLLMIGKRFGEYRSNQLHVQMHFTHKEIGLFSGTSRETVTRVLNELEKEGLIAFDKKNLSILDVKKLEENLLRTVR